MAKAEDYLNADGRVHDGWAYLLGMKSGESHRFCDHDGFEGVWARIQEAAKKGTFVTFSGARAEANGKLDGFGTVLAADVVSFKNFGASALGISPVEERLSAIEKALNEAIAEIEDINDYLEGDEEGGDGDEDEDSAPTAVPSILPPSSVQSVPQLPQEDD